MRTTMWRVRYTEPGRAGHLEDFEGVDDREEARRRVLDRHPGVDVFSVQPWQKECRCGGDAFFRNHCGVFVCGDGCGHHEGLTRCYCGWSESGRDGRRELIEMGETIEEEW